jgi:hypothetical protein
VRFRILAWRRMNSHSLPRRGITVFHRLVNNTAKCSIAAYVLPICNMALRRWPEEPWVRITSVDDAWRFLCGADSILFWDRCKLDLIVVCQA